MYRLICIILCLGTILPVSGQKFGVSVEAGQLYGVLKKSENDAPFASDLKYSLGAGIYRQAMFHFYPDSSNWHFSGGLRWFTGKGVITARSGTPMQAGETAQYVQHNALGLVTRLTYMFELNRFRILISGGPYLPLRTVQNEETWQYDTTGHAITYARLGNYFSAGFSGGLGLQTALTPKIRFCIGAELTVLNGRAKTRSVTGHFEYGENKYDERFGDVAERETFYRKDVNGIRNNKDVLPAAFNPGLPTDKISYNRSYSGLGLQFGLVFTL